MSKEEIKNYIKDNLRLEIREEFQYYGDQKYVSFELHFEEDIISSDSIRI